MALPWLGDTLHVLLICRASYHIKFNFYFEDQATWRAFAKELHQAINTSAPEMMMWRKSPSEEPTPIMDLNPYSCNQAWRLLYCTKEGSDRRLVPYGDSSPELKDHLLTVIGEPSGPKLPALPGTSIIRQIPARQGASETRQNHAEAAIQCTAPEGSPSHIPSDLLKDMVMGLSSQRAVEEPTWYGVGCAIGHTAVACGYQDRGREIFHQFSQQHPASYDVAAADAKYSRIVAGEPGEGFEAVINMLRKDNHDMLRQLQNGHYKQLFQHLRSNKTKQTIEDYFTPTFKRDSWTTETYSERYVKEYSIEDHTVVIIGSMPGTGGNTSAVHANSCPATPANVRSSDLCMHASSHWDASETVHNMTVLTCLWNVLCR